MGHEHIVTLQNDVPIELDSSKGIQAIEYQDCDGAIMRRANGRQVDSICPALVGNPLGLEFVEP
jgi:hypothetical protein